MAHLRKGDIMVLDKIKEIIKNTFGRDVSTLNENTDILKDLKLDSLDIVDLVMAVEEEWGLVVDDSDIEKLRTLGDVVKYIESNI